MLSEDLKMMGNTFAADVRDEILTLEYFRELVCHKSRLLEPIAK